MPITTLFSEMVIRYLRSKALMFQTVMDMANQAFFATLIVTNVLVTLIVTLSNYLSDTGDVIAETLAWSFLFMTECVVMGALINVTVQLLIVNRPSILESEMFEMIVKGLVVVALPVLSATLCLALKATGSKPYEYFHLRGINEAPRDMKLELIGTGLNSTFLLQFVISRCWIRQKGYYLNAESNHIIKTEVLALLVAVAFFFYALCKFTHSAEQFKMVTLVIHCLFAILTVCAHDSLRAYALRRSPFCQMLSLVHWLSKITRSRKVNFLNDMP